MSNIKARVSMLSSDDVPEDIQIMYHTWEEKLGKIPEWAQVMAHKPKILKHFAGLMKATMGSEEVSEELKWTIAYHVSKINECEYCVKVTSKKLESMGMKEELVDEVEKRVEEMEEKEMVALKYAHITTKEAYKLPEEVFNNLKEYYNENQIVEITAVVGLFNFINRFNDALGVLPGV
ncbi:MAG: hypothetical protein GF349_04500 [Candidatus Magasanikbacteria bacterium]|nr:hypothetical protein [Candidatus Magasanikbacteria bacterium]